MPLQILKNALGRLVPMPQGLGGLVGNELAQQVNDQTRTALTASLLQAAGPSRMPVSLGQALGGSMANAQNVQMNAINLALQRKAAMDKAQRAADAQKFLGPILQNMAGGPAGGNLAGNPLLAQALAAEAMIDPQRTLAQLPGILSAQAGKTDPLDQPVLDKAVNLAFPNGEHPPGTMTFREAYARGARAATQSEQDKQASAQTATGMLTQLSDLALGNPQKGTTGLFTGVEPGIINRAQSAIKFGIDWAEQNDTRLSEYEGLKKTITRTLARAFGDKGALSDADIADASQSLPTTWPIPDTYETAQRKIAHLNDLIALGTQRLAAGIDVRTQGTGLPPLPPGYHLDK